MKGDYNVPKYLDAFNNRVESLIVGFNPEIRDKILVKINRKGELVKNEFTSKQLELMNFDLDDFDEAMTLESKEVAFWNRYGYDPRLIWNGFKVRDDDRVYYEIYDGALEYLNGLMEKSNKPLIKSINDKYGKGDYVLIKDGSEYRVGLFNGVYMEIVRDNVQVPKSKIELELDEKMREEEEKIKRLQKSTIISNKIDAVEEENRKMYLEKAFNDFKKQFGWDMNMTIEDAEKQYGTQFTQMLNESVDMLMSGDEGEGDEDFDIDSDI